MLQNKLIHFLLIVIFAFVCCGLVTIFPDVVSLTPVQTILFFIFIVGALCWVFEPIPQYATSLFIIGSLTFLISDSGFSPLRAFFNEHDQSSMLSYKSIFNAFSAPVIILFLGGFALAIATTKYHFDTKLAKILLKPFGNRPSLVMLGLMAITALLAMFMSNTATTVMMLAAITPVLSVVDKNDPGLKGLILGIPFAANIGGVGTPIGTPPNAIALSYVEGEASISFLQWMSWGMPVAIIGVLATWLILLWMFPFKSEKIEVKFAEDGEKKSWKNVVVAVTFALTVILWLTEKLHGINSYSIALFPIIVFLMTRVLVAEDIKHMNWDVIWLVAGGIAIGDALSATGLAKVFANCIDYSQYSPMVVILLISFLGWVVSNFISSTSTANLMIPISVALLHNVDLSQFSMSTAIFTVAISFSFAMSLPISTPPNALAYATGLIKGKDMFKAGFTIGVMCLLLGFATFEIISRIQQ